MRTHSPRKCQLLSSSTPRPRQARLTGACATRCSPRWTLTQSSYAYRAARHNACAALARAALPTEVLTEKFYKFPVNRVLPASLVGVSSQSVALPPFWMTFRVVKPGQTDSVPAQRADVALRCMDSGVAVQARGADNLITLRASLLSGVSVLRPTRARAPLVQQLPAELLTDVFFRLSDNGIFPASRVCKSWRGVALGYPPLWTTIRVVNPGQSAPASVPRADVAVCCIDGVVAVLARSGGKPITLHASLQGDVSSVWADALSIALVPHAARIENMQVFYEDADVLDVFPIFSASAGAFPNLRDLVLVLCTPDAEACDPDDDDEDASDLHLAPVYPVLADVDDTLRFANLASCTTRAKISWLEAPLDLFPALRSLDMWASKTEQILAAVDACPQLATLRICVTKDGEDMLVDDYLAARIRAIGNICLSGHGIDDVLLAVLDCTAPRALFRIDCDVFWWKFHVLFEGFAGLQSYEHIIVRDQHVVTATNAARDLRVLTASVDEAQDYEWKDFYGHGPLRDMLASLPSSAVQIPQEYS